MKQKAGFVLAIGFLGLLNLIEPPVGLSEEGMRASAVFLFATALWIGEVMHYGVTSMLVLLLFPALGVMSFAEALSGFSSTTVWLLLSSFIISAALFSSGLHRRIALWLLLLSKGRPSYLVLSALSSVVVSLFLIPTGLGRVTLLTPVFVRLGELLERKGRSNLIKDMLLGLSSLSLFASTSIIIGGMGIVYAAEMFSDLGFYTWNYLSWMLAFFPVTLVFVFVFWVALIRLFPPEELDSGEVQRQITGEYRRLGKMTPEEYRVSLLIVLMVLLFATGSLTGLGTAYIAMLVATLALLPVFGMVKWKEAISQINWGIIFLVAASIAMVRAVQQTGVAHWVAEHLLQQVSTNQPVLVLGYVILACIVIRFLSNTLILMLSTTLPIVFAFGQLSGINPVWLGMVAVVVSNSAHFYPMQSPQHMITYSTGYYTSGELFQTGIISTTVLVLITSLMALFYWPILGYTP